MNDLQQLKVRLSQLPDEDLLRMVNEDIVRHRQEELTLAYAEMERRGLLPAPIEETPATISRLGCLIAVVVFMVEFVLTHQAVVSDELLPLPRAFALAVLVGLVAGFWERGKLSASFGKHLLFSLGLVMLGSFALWDLPNLLRQRIPVVLAFGIPGAPFAVFFFWLVAVYLPRLRQRILSEMKE